MDDKIFDKIHEVDLKETMETSYIDYAMSVIASRALPDVRDGLKPVQRRVLYSILPFVTWKTLFILNRFSINSSKPVHVITV